MDEEYGFGKYVVISTLFYVVLGVIFAMVRIQFSPIKRKLIEMDFVTEVNINPKTVEKKEVTKIINKPNNIVKSKVKHKKTSIKPPSKLPIKDYDDNDVFIAHKPIKNKVFDDEVPNFAPRPIQKDVFNNTDNIMPVVNKKRLTEHNDTLVFSNSSNPGKEKIFKSKISNFELKGEIAQRKLLNSPVLSAAEVKANTIIQLSFDVLPDGKVVNIKVIKKGDPYMENKTIELMKEWYFEPLPKNVSNRRTQKGVVNFIYKLK